MCVNPQLPMMGFVTNPTADPGTECWLIFLVSTETGLMLPFSTELPFSTVGRVYHHRSDETTMSRLFSQVFKI